MHLVTQFQGFVRDGRTERFEEPIWRVGWDLREVQELRAISYGASKRIVM